jgi:peptidoglycan/xylan/chitin deacetylase (PgdA/CDA1 family)
MKIIVSHDVDHISTYEHMSDLVVPKYIGRAGVELLKGRIGPGQFAIRMGETLIGKWNFIRELAAFDAEVGIKSTFFFAVGNGMGLAYQPEAARELLHEVIAAGHDVGIHGIARDTVDNIRDERIRFEAVYGVSCRGQRMHYLHPDPSLLDAVAAAGFTYDSSLRGDGPARNIGGLWSFPVHVMDGDVMLGGRRYQTVSVREATDKTRRRIEALAESGVDYVSLLFHDRYFSAGHAAWRDWYKETMQWATQAGIEFCNYEQAVNELEVRCI